MLFHFQPGQLVIRRHRIFSKMDPRSGGPFRVVRVSGLYRQRVTVEPVNAGPARAKRTVIVHAGHLVPLNSPYEEPEVLDLNRDMDPEPPVIDGEPPPPPVPTSPRRTRLRAKRRAAGGA